MYPAWILTFLLINAALIVSRRIIHILAACVAVICAVSIIKGHNQPRLEGVISGIYSNPNDLAFAVVLTPSFALAFMITSKGAFKKILWMIGMLASCWRRLFLTASRSGFLNLIILLVRSPGGDFGIRTANVLG